MEVKPVSLKPLCPCGQAFSPTAGLGGQFRWEAPKCLQAGVKYGYELLGLFC